MIELDNGICVSKGIRTIWFEKDGKLFCLAQSLIQHILNSDITIAELNLAIEKLIRSKEVPE